MLARPVAAPQPACPAGNLDAPAGFRTNLLGMLS